MTIGAVAALLAGGARLHFVRGLPAARHVGGLPDAAAPATGAAGPDAWASPNPFEMTRVFVANRGKLVGPWSGFAWVAGAAGVQIDTPTPCDERGCFRGTGGLLCTRGTMAAPRGSRPNADAGTDDPWAVKIGLDVRRDGGSWGSSGEPYVSIEYRGAAHVRLAAHRMGDGEREYCVDDYTSGDVVRVDRFRASCWKGGGDALATFDDVDKFMLELPAGDEATSFDYCITTIRVGRPVDVPDAASDATGQTLGESGTP